MAHSVVIRDVVYSDCPAVTIPKYGASGDAVFTDTSDATLNSGSQMLAGVTGYGDGVKYTGSIPSKSSSDLTVSGSTVTVPAGNYSTQATKSVASGSATAPATISGTSGSQLYVGGSAYGTANTTFTNHIQNNHLTGVTLSKNQTVAVYARSRGSNYYAYVGTLVIKQTA